MNQEKTRQEEHKEIASNTKAYQLGIRLAEMSFNNEEAENFRDFLNRYFDITLSRVSIANSLLSVINYAGKGENGVITEEVVLTSEATSAAIATQPKTIEEIENLTIEYKKNPDVIAAAKTKFAQLQQDHPDSNPENDSINIEEAAAKDLEFLREAFPEHMQSLEQKIIGSKDMNAVELLNKLEAKQKHEKAEMAR